jgi:mono/diheme cytochrome c family protein/ketosteroid isomerase-like protein
MKMTRALLLLLVLGFLGAAACVYFGLFNVAADEPHGEMVRQLLETVRQRSVTARANDIQVPPLDDPALVAEGAGHYSEMCSGCHLAPGVADSEIREGLYPQPPNLSQRSNLSPAEMFWTIKHGIKMSAMPAWGTTHDNQAIWNIVAFVQKLPTMTPEQYLALTHNSGETAEGHHHHDHADASEEHEHPAESDSHDHNADAGSNGEHAHTDNAQEAPMSMEGLKPKAIPDAERVAEEFHAALQKGDRDAVLALLATDVRVSEAGLTQSRDEYAAGHLAEDIAFMKAAKVAPVSRASKGAGETAVVGSESEIHATVKGEPRTFRSREILTLKRESGSWKIVDIQWQSIPDGR